MARRGNGVEIELDVTGNWEQSFKAVQSTVDHTRSKVAALGGTLDKIRLNADGALKSAKGQMNGVDFQIRQKTQPISEAIANINSQQSSGGQGMLSSVLFGSLGASAVLGSLAAVTGALGNIKTGLLEAASIETQSIARSSDIGTNLGLNIKKARELHEGTQIAIADIAAALPGVTKDYTAVLDGIAPAISSAFVGDSKGYQAAILDVTKRTGVLAATSHADPTMAGSGLNRFISGTSGFQEVMMIDIFQKNAQFQKGLRDGLANLGVSTEDWKNLTTKQRLKITQDALKIATPDTLLKEFEGTAESIIQTWQTNLFDPMKGAFGMLRRVEGSGNRTALQAFTGTLNSLNGLFDTIAKKTGIKVDPMGMLITALDWLSNLTLKASVMISKFDGKLDINGMLDRFYHWMTSWDSTKLGGNVGDIIGNVFRTVGAYLAGLNWVAVGAILGQGATRALEFLSAILTTPGFWVGVAAILGAGILAAMEILVGLIAGVLRGLADWFVNSVKRAWDMISGIFGGLFDVLGSVRDAVMGWQQKAASFVPGVSGAVQGIAKAVTGATSGQPLGDFSGTGTQVKALESIGLSSGTQSSSVFSPTVNVHAQTQVDAGQIARMTMDKIGEMYGVATQGAL